MGFKRCIQVVRSDDFHPRAQHAVDQEQVLAYATDRANSALIDIQMLLRRRIGKTLGDFQGMTEPIIPEPNDPKLNHLIADEVALPLADKEEIAKMVQSLNADQMNAYDRIKYAYETSTSEAFFIDGPAGTGKTFLYSLILSAVRPNHDVALAVAGSGIASLLLQGGRTVHSRFKVPILPMRAVFAL